MGQRMKCHATLVGKVEKGKRTPTPDFAMAADAAFELDGHFVELATRVAREAAGPRWWYRWTDEVEPQAVILQSWDPMLVPGLLQTPAYARAVLGSSPLIVSDQLEGAVAARTARRAILDRTPPPRVCVLMDEGVLHRPVGGRNVLLEQLHYLLEAARCPCLTVQVVPIAAACAAGMMAAFALARLPTGAEVATVDSLREGHTTADVDAVAEIRLWYETIRADACSRFESLQIIEKAVARWTG
ncbi:transcriptional regulator [Microtetraspora sp. NBRC 13810]|nr:transcriptional regulator [Microtetraspora sp. NBRC 13810]